MQQVLQRLAAEYGYTPLPEVANGEVIALQRDQASITLEPAAQLELSGAPLATIHETAQEFETHAAELKAVSEPLGIRWLSLGFHPLARQEDLPHVPKLRYAVMKQYLPTRGARALDMMRRTCTVQANLDYASLDDAMRKLRIALALQPVTTAMFANSPFIEGQPSAYLSERAHVWLHMDPDRSGLLPFAWQEAAKLSDYIDWALQVPMFGIKRAGKLIPNTKQTFATFMRDGLGGITATTTDWETHLNTLFPEVRLKKTLEVRGADAQPGSQLCALPALWKGLLYDPQALAEAEQLISNLDYSSVQAARLPIAQHGLRASLAGRPVQRWGEEVLDLATAGLQRQAAAAGGDESVYLAPIRALVSSGLTPADLLRKQLGASPSISGLLELTGI